MTSCQNGAVSSEFGATSVAETQTVPAQRWAAVWSIVLAVFLSFLVSSAVRRPVPSVNEPHYLCKAKHYWQPQWCAGDLFLESSNPHLVFYQTLGVLTQWLTLSQTAWVGRAAALGCLAVGWTLLISRLLKSRWLPLAAAWIFLLLQSLGTFSGEWLVGGVESKVFAYAFAFSGLAMALDRRWILAGFGMGLAISFHPLVGLWCLIAAALAVVGQTVLDSRTVKDRVVIPPAWRSMVSGLVVMGIVSLPGLLPAISLLRGTDPAVAAEADLLQVGMRLSHHLDPARFPLASYRYYGLLLVLAGLLGREATRTRPRRWLARIVVASVVIAVIGALVGWGPRPLEVMPLSKLRVWMLKFYPFRLADLLVPVLVSVSALAAMFETRRCDGLTLIRRRCVWIACGIAFVVSLVLPTVDRYPSRMSDLKRADWTAMCDWVRLETPADSLLYAANEDWAVKWFAHRPEYVNYKDCPQDAEGIVEWADRLRLMNEWSRAAFADGSCSTDDLDRLHAETGITHLIVSRFGPIDAAPIYENASFRVFAVGGA